MPQVDVHQKVIPPASLIWSAGGTSFWCTSFRTKGHTASVCRSGRGRYVFRSWLAAPWLLPGCSRASLAKAAPWPRWLPPGLHCCLQASLAALGCSCLLLAAPWLLLAASWLCCLAAWLLPCLPGRPAPSPGRCLPAPLRRRAGGSSAAEPCAARLWRLVSMQSFLNHRFKIVA